MARKPNKNICMRKPKTIKTFKIYDVHVVIILPNSSERRRKRMARSHCPKKKSKWERKNKKKERKNERNLERKANLKREYEHGVLSLK